MTTHAAQLVPIRLQIIAESGVRHPKMFGIFSHKQLITAQMMDEQLGSVTWKRQPMETCAEYEARVIEDIRQLMARDSEQAPMANECAA